MLHSTCRCASGIVIALAVGFVAPAVEGASPEGHWRLVEQRYGAGGANLARVDEPLHLEFVREGAGLRGTIWAGASPDRPYAWPAFVTEAGPLAVEVLSRGIDAAAGTVEVRYRVRPAPDDDLVLEIVERYAASEDGRSLEGTMDVVFTGGERNRGGFTLHRRFERVP